MDSQTISVNLDDMSLDELVMLSQGLGHDIDRLRAKRAHVAALINSRVKVEQRDALIREAEERLASISGEAPGAVLDATAQA